MSAQGRPMTAMLEIGDRAVALPPDPGVGGSLLREGLGLQEALLAVQEGPASELARLGNPDAQRRQMRQQASDQQRVAMELELHHILARVAGGGGEVEHGSTLL